MTKAKKEAFLYGLKLKHFRFAEINCIFKPFGFCSREKSHIY